MRLMDFSLTKHGNLYNVRESCNVEGMGNSD